MSDFVTELERELRAASRRRVRLAAARLPRPALGPVVPGLRAAPAALAVLVALAVGVYAVAVVGHGHRPTVTTGSAPGRQRLIDVLAPLRRPQTAADRAFVERALAHGGVPFHGTPDLSLVRYAATTPWGERIYIVPFRPASAAVRARVRRTFPHTTFLLNEISQESFGVFSRGGGGCCATATELATHGSTGEEGAGRSFAGGASRERITSVVPDGVATVRFVFARQPFGRQYGGPTYRHPLTVTVPVHGNLAAVQVSRECCGGQVMIWYDAAGHVINRIGSLAAANRVVAPPRPGPETALSRAAERDPSTPNRVWVTPGIGGPGTVFSVHFRVLLNGADYRYRVTGTRCPRYTFPSGIGKPNALRGSVWSDPLSAVMGQMLCPGTYHVAVSVMSRARSFRATPNARPFGSASFTVR